MPSWHPDQPADPDDVPAVEGPALERRFRAMGTTVTLYVRPQPDQEERAASQLERLETWFYRAESVLTRFPPDSELSLLNAAPVRFNLVSPLLGRVLHAALRAARRTEGLFDPTVLPDVEAAGYDRSLDELLGSAQGLKLERRGADSRASSRWTSVRVDKLNHERYWLVDRPPGVRFDLGGIAKGWAADQAASALSAHGPAAADVGGDVRVVFPRRYHGRADFEQSGRPQVWPVVIADPFSPQGVLAHFGLRGGAVATSDTLGRRWLVGAEWKHHIIDPRNGCPAESDAVAATVVARSAVLAEALAKACVILGSDDAVPFVEQRGALTLVVRADRSLAISHELRRIVDVESIPNV